MTQLEQMPRPLLGEAEQQCTASLKAIYSAVGEQKILDVPAQRAMFRSAGAQGLLAPRAGLSLLDDRSQLVRMILAHEVHTTHVGNALPLLNNALTVDLVTRLGSEQQKQDWLPRMSSGELSVGLALIESGANLKPEAFATSAERAGEDYIIRGEKTGIYNSDTMDAIVVVAKAKESNEFGFFLIDFSAVGLDAGKENASGDARENIFLDNLKIDSGRLLGGQMVSSVEVEKVLSLLRLAQCARSVARGDLALSLAIDCAKNNTLEGRDLFRNQSVQFKFSELKAELLSARAFLDECIDRVAKNSEEIITRSLMARLWIGDAEERIITEASQVIGAHAYSEKYPLAVLGSQARAENLLSGSKDIIRLEIFERTNIASDQDFDALSIDRDPDIFSEEHRLYRNSFRRFFEKEVEPFCHGWIETGKVPKELYAKASQAGLLAGGIPEAYDGAGADELNYLVGCEEVGRSRAGPIVGPLFQSDGLIELLKKHGTERQKEAWFPRLLDGAVPGFAMTEPQSGSDVRAFRTVARRDGNDYVINGNKCFISFARVADLFFVLAKTDINDPKHLSFFIVDAKTPGIHANRMKTLVYRCGDTCEVFFTDVRVPKEALLGEVEGQALNQAKGMLDLGHIQVGARALGSADLAYRQALVFSLDRKVFGRNLIEFENTRAVLAQVKTEINVARALLDYCYKRYQQGTLDHATGSISKFWHSNFEWRTVDRCFQFFGGAGFISEHPISHQVFGARVDRILDGTDEMQKQAISYSL
ncbi:MAG: acyl-CoA dehydrogenase family protein [Porticoccaceae bacterium]